MHVAVSHNYHVGNTVMGGVTSEKLPSYGEGVTPCRVCRQGRIDSASSPDDIADVWIALGFQG